MSYHVSGFGLGPLDDGFTPNSGTSSVNTGTTPAPPDVVTQATAYNPAVQATLEAFYQQQVAPFEDVMWSTPVTVIAPARAPAATVGSVLPLVAGAGLLALALLRQ